MAPRRPVLKLSMVRTVLASKGTAVPPAVMHTTGLPRPRLSSRNASNASPVCFSLTCARVGGFGGPGGGKAYSRGNKKEMQSREREDAVAFYGRQ